MAGVVASGGARRFTRAAQFLIVAGELMAWLQNYHEQVWDARGTVPFSRQLRIGETITGHY
jgi:hypothetical protein